MRQAARTQAETLARLVENAIPKTKEFLQSRLGGKVVGKTDDGHDVVRTSDGALWVCSKCRVTINVKHIFHGEINVKGRAVGFHHAGSIGHHGKARISSILAPPNAQGVYQAKVQVYDEASGRWIDKVHPSTFFPDAWSRARVLDEVRVAFNFGTVSGNMFVGTSPSGVVIKGYLDSAGNIITAFPMY